jgi:hypothetical protein
VDVSFTAAMMYWVAIDTPGASEEQAAEFNLFYDEVHVPEVLRHNPGFVRVHRYELLKDDARGAVGPRWLAAYEVDQEGARAYAQRNDGLPDGRPRYSSGPKVWENKRLIWRMIWRRIDGFGAPSTAAASIFIVGMDAGDDDPIELERFNDFYSNVHLPEIVTGGGYARGTRSELDRSFLYPERPCPRYCAVYDCGEELTTAIREGSAGPTVPDPSRRLSPGPPAWESHQTAWRLVYLRI